MTTLESRPCNNEASIDFGLENENVNLKIRKQTNKHNFWLI